MAICAAGGALALAVGALGEIADYRVTVSFTALVTMVICWLTVWKNRSAVRAVYEPAEDK